MLKRPAPIPGSEEHVKTWLQAVCSVAWVLIPGLSYAQATQDVVRGDNLEFTRLSYHYELSAPFFNQAADREVANVCMPKPTGTLDFTLDTAGLGLPSLLVPMHGEALGVNQVRWTANLDMHTCVTMPDGSQFTVTHVQGSITALLTQQDSPVAGVCRSDYADALSDMGDGTITVDAYQGCGTWGIGGQVRVSNLTLRGWAGREAPQPVPHLATVSLRPSSTCGSPNRAVPVTGVASLTTGAPRGGFNVDLVSTDPSIALSTSRVTVPRGASSAGFSLTVPAGYSGAFSVKASAWSGSEQREAAFTVTAPIFPRWGCQAPKFYYVKPWPRWSYCAACGFRFLDELGDPAIVLERQLDTELKDTVLLGGTSRATVSGFQVGTYWDAKGTPRGFIQNVLKGTIIDVPRASLADVNAKGTSVGYRLDGFGQRVAVRADTKGGLKDLGSLGGSVSEAMALNSLGDVVGSALDGQKVTRAFLYTASTGKLSTLPLPSSTSSVARALNEDGEVVGSYVDLKGTQRAFFYSPATGKSYDTELLPGFLHATLRGVNGNGLAVGTQYLKSPTDTEGAVAVRYTPKSGTERLADLVDPADGLEIREALAINDAGEILVSGLLDGKPATFLLVPQQ